MSTPSCAAGIHDQVIYNPERDDLAALLMARPTHALLSAIVVTPSQIVLRFGPPTPIWQPYVPPIVWPLST
jgi:hypothetical protein